MDDNALNKILLKPRFKLTLEQEPENVISKFKENLEHQNCEYCSTISQDHIFIDVPKAQQKIWSPQLELVVENSEKGSSIRGLFAPKPGIWTFFIFLHFVVAVGFFIFFALAYANSVAGNETKTWYIMMGLMVFLWFFLYLLGQIGKNKAKNQIRELKHFLRNSLEKFDLKSNS